MAIQPLIAFGFGNLAMLGWLAAAAAPLLIHLWSRHRFREAPWAAMQFLLAAMRKNARRLQLQQWLLLAVRTLIILLVVCAVAEPYGERLLARPSGAPKHIVLIIDGSYSMDYRDANTRCFARAKQAAVSLVRESRSADSFTVILMAAPARIVLGREVVDHDDVAAQIEALPQLHTGADLAGALSLVEKVMQEEQSKSNAPRACEICFFTDLQRKTWQLTHEGSDAGDSPLKRRISDIAKSGSISVVDVGATDSINTAVTNLSAAGPFAVVDREFTVDATLRQFGLEKTQRNVALYVDGRPVSEQSVDVSADGETTVRFSYRFNTPAEHIVEVRSSPDRLTIDNTRFLVIPVRDQIRILCVAGSPGAARYVADALNPNPAGESPIQPVVVSDGDLADLDLANFEAIFFCNVAQLTPSEAQRLATYTAAGGGVVFFLGDRVAALGYESISSGDEPLLPVIIGDVVDQLQFGIDPLEYRHPIVAPFRGRERAGLLTTPVGKYHHLTLADSQNKSEVVAALSNGDPFIVAAPFGLGRVVVVATDGSLSSVDSTTGEPWTSWPTWPSFLPIVRELLAFAMSGRQQEWEHTVGETISGNMPDVSSRTMTGFAPGDVRIERPDGTSVPAIVHTTPHGATWSYADTDLSGIYSLSTASDNESRRFAVNIDASESDLHLVDPQELPVELRSIRDMSNDFVASGDADPVRAGWNTSLLWGAFALLLVESFLGWQFGRGAL